MPRIHTARNRWEGMISGASYRHWLQAIHLVHFQKSPVVEDGLVGPGQNGTFFAPMES